jgi:transcriptional regulator of arginine metabolism
MMNIHSSARRKDEILRIVRETTVHSQDEILTALKKHGFKVTQPTLSRDLRDLGLAKTPSGYIVPGDVAMAPVVTFTPREVRENKTPAAAAQPLASAIDYGDVEDALGTVGGDDTIFVALRTPTAATAFARRLQQIAGLSPERRRSRA